MRKLVKRILIVMSVITMTLFLVACGGDDPAPETVYEPAIEVTPEPTPELTPEPTPVPTPVKTPEPTPEVTPEPEVIGFKFPFSFSSVDLQGNPVTEEDLGEKELFFAYIWAVW